MFEIAVQDPVHEDEGGVAADIVIGSFHETFRISSPTWTPEDFREQWRRALERFVGGSGTACLVTWHAPGVVNRGWVLYKEGSSAHIQEILFMALDDPPRVTEDGVVGDIPTRETVSEDGEPISEWQTTVADIEAFLGR